MVTLGDLVFIGGVILISVIILYLANFVLRLERKNDLRCFLIGDWVFVIFMFLMIFSEFQQVPNLLSSLVISELTLALVWVELSKRPELKLLGVVPIVWDFMRGHEAMMVPPSIWRADGSRGQFSEPSDILRIREATISQMLFDKYFSFAVDVANIGYQDITVHEYTVYLDGKRQPPSALVTQTNERVSLGTQQRHTINIPLLGIHTSGHHTVCVDVIASTVKCSKEIWFFISKDSKKVRFLGMNPYKHLASPLIRSKLQDP